jgi:hypothetical protein
MVAMVQILGELAFNAVLSRGSRCRADVVMGTNEYQVIGIVEEMLDRLDFGRGCNLIGAERVEADHHNVHAGKRAIERRHCTVIGNALDLNDSLAWVSAGRLQAKYRSTLRPHILASK